MAEQDTTPTAEEAAAWMNTQALIITVGFNGEVAITANLSDAEVVECIDYLAKTTREKVEAGGLDA